MEELEGDRSELDFAILQTLKTHGQPIGSGTLHYILRDRGDNLSVLTIGPSSAISNTTAS